MSQSGRVYHKRSQIPLPPRRYQLAGPAGVGLVKQQMVGRVEGYETFREGGGGEDACGMVDPDRGVVRGVEDEEGAGKSGDRLVHVMRRNVVEELPVQPELPVADLYSGRPGAGQFLLIAIEQVGESPRGCGGGDSDQGSARG